MFGEGGKHLGALGRSAVVVGGFVAVCCCAIAPANASAVLQESFLQPMGQVAAEQRDHLLRVVAITMVVILPVLVGVPLILWRYRYGKGRGAYAPEWEFSKALEIALWGVPILVVATLGSWLWYSAAKLDPYQSVGKDPLQVQAIGLDWKWIFVYPDEGIATVNELALPVGRPIELTLTTDTVMQSLLIAPLTGQIYAMPGMTTRLNFAASRPGVALGENTQFNGSGFGRQKFIVRAVAAKEYRAWLASAKDDPTLDEATYAILRRQSVLADARADLGLDRSARPLVMRLAEPAMFERIVAKYHHTGRGAPEAWGGTGRPAASASGGR